MKRTEFADLHVSLEVLYDMQKYITDIISYKYVITEANCLELLQKYPSFLLLVIDKSSIYIHHCFYLHGQISAISKQQSLN